MTSRYQDMTEVNQRDGSPNSMPVRRSVQISSLHSSDEDNLMRSIRSMSLYPSFQAPPSDPSTLLGNIGKLPIELRTMIYNLLLPPPDPISFPASATILPTRRTGCSTAAALMTCSSTFRAEIFPFLYERRHIVFISSPVSLEMCIDNKNVSLSIASEHTRLYKLDIHTLTIYLKPNWLLNAPLIHRNHFHHLQGLIYALKHASSIKCLHVRFAAEFQPPPSDVVRVIETYLGLIVKIEKLHRIPEVHIHNMLPQTLLDQNKWMRDVQRIVAVRLKENLKAMYKTWQDTEWLSVRSAFGLRLPISDMKLGKYTMGWRERYGGDPCKEGCTGDCWTYAEREDGWKADHNPRRDALKARLEKAN